MNKDNIWSIFERTGSINAYITYKQKDQQKENSIHEPAVPMEQQEQPYTNTTG